MPVYSPQDVSDAFRRMLGWRNAVVERLSMTDPAEPGVPLGSRPLPAGADEGQIRALEGQLGRTLPPSYKIWLRMHDGAAWANLGSDFFSIAQVTGFESNEKAKFFGRNLARFKKDSAEDLIVFAASADRNTTIVFDAGKPDEFGEWPVIYLSKRDKVLYDQPDFVQFLGSCSESLQNLLRLYS